MPDQEWQDLCIALGFEGAVSAAEIIERYDMMSRAAGILLPSRLQRANQADKLVKAMGLLNEVVHSYRTEDFTGSS